MASSSWRLLGGPGCGGDEAVLRQSDKRANPTAPQEMVANLCVWTCLTRHPFVAFFSSACTTQFFTHHKLDHPSIVRFSKCDWTASLADPSTRRG